MWGNPEKTCEMVYAEIKAVFYTVLSTATILNQQASPYPTFVAGEASTTVNGFWSCQPVRDSLSLWREPQRKDEVPSRHNLVEKKIINSYHSPTPFGWGFFIF